MNTLLIASLLAFVNDPTGGTTGTTTTTTTSPTCEEQLRQTQYQLSISEDVIEAAIDWALSISIDPASGATADCPPDSEICEAADFCQGSTNFPACVTLTCSYLPGNCL